MTKRLSALLLLLTGLTANSAETPPATNGTLHVTGASWIGGAGSDSIVAARILPRGGILLAGNTSDAKSINPDLARIAQAATGPKAEGKPKDIPESHGWLARLDADGAKIEAGAWLENIPVVKMKLDANGNCYLLCDAAGEFDLSGTKGHGRFIARISADLKSIETVLKPAEDVWNFDVDANGDILVLCAGKLLRFDSSGKTRKWTATFDAFGDNHPGGIAVDQKSGMTIVDGFGMTKTGHEPYRDPYAYGFDRSGKQLWALWNPDPTHEADVKYGGNGLMADTSGSGAYFGADGKAYLCLYADGGNTVCARDPHDPDKPLAGSVMDNVFQKTPGFGFKGASKTSIVFRVNPADGQLEKGTWMCAWITPARANSLKMSDITADNAGHLLVAGVSASGCPTKNPWYTASEGGYQGGGYLAVFDANFGMLQCGYFPGSTINAVDCRDGTVVIAGSAPADNSYKGAAGQEQTYPVPIRDALQPRFGGGPRDGYFVILRF